MRASELSRALASARRTRVATAHAPPRILVVDDDTGVRESLADALGEAGYEVVCARDGLEALALLDAADRPPDLILLDVMMPRMDGLAFRQRQLGSPALAAIPVVMLTAHPSVDEHTPTLLGADVLRKPVQLVRLLDKVAHHCERGPRR